jgi:hypothetical protein
MCVEKCDNSPLVTNSHSKIDLSPKKIKKIQVNDNLWQKKKKLHVIKFETKLAEWLKW